MPTPPGDRDPEPSPNAPLTGAIRVSYERWTAGAGGPGVSFDATDQVVVEEPLEIVLVHGEDRQSVSVTMRTPGEDFDLVCGFLFSEGLLVDPAGLERLVSREAEGDQIVEVHTRAPVHLDPSALRRFLVSSSCGVCGRALLRGLMARGADVRSDRLPVAPSVLARLPAELRARQRLFAVTGGLHAAALFDAHGRLLSVAEDVGRHNAVDKVLGARFRSGTLPASGTILQVSGRASFEIVQKAAAAGIPVLSAVSAPSSLAVSAADAAGVTLAGFVGPNRVNVYTHPWRTGLGDPRAPAQP